VTEISIILGVRQRTANTRRALESYEKLTYKDYEILFMDCVGESNQLGVYNEFKNRLPIKYHLLQEDFGRYVEDETTWSPATTWNTGIRKSESKFVIVTSADIIISAHDALEKFLAQYRGNRISALTYFLSNEITDSLGGVDWKSNSGVIRSMEGFGDFMSRGRTNQEPLPPAQLTFLTGMEKSEWESIGCFRTQLSHLVNDQDLHLREMFLGREVDTWDGCVAYHQAHPVGERVVDVTRPGWHYETERQARLIDEAPRDET
jgi:hypothetical protein